MTPESEQELFRSIGNIEGTLTALKDAHDKAELRHEEFRTSTSSRVSRLEKHEKYLAGLFVGAGAVVGFLSKYVPFLKG